MLGSWTCHACASVCKRVRALGQSAGERTCLHLCEALTLPLPLLVVAVRKVGQPAEEDPEHGDVRGRSRVLKNVRDWARALTVVEREEQRGERGWRLVY